MPVSQQFLCPWFVFRGGFARVARIDVFESELFTISDAVGLREFAGPLDDFVFFHVIPLMDGLRAVR